MYQILHEHKRIAIVIMGTATLGFLLWLFLQNDLPNFIKGSKCVAEADKICITLNEYRREMLKYSSLSTNREIENMIKQQVIENLIVQNLLYRESKHLGFTASDEEVVQTIKLDPTFQENGIFSSYKYREILSRNGLEADQYEEHIRKILSIQKLLVFIQNGVYMTEEEAKINQAVSSIELSGKLYILSPSDIKETIEVTEKEIKDYYEKNKEKFKTEPKRSLRLWVETDKEKASSIYKSLKSGNEVPNFTVYKLPDDASKLEPQITKAMENLTELDPISVTKIGDKYYVMQLQHLEKAGYKDLNEVKKELEAEISNLKKSELLSKKAKDLATALTKSGDIDARYIVFESTPIPRILNFLRVEQMDVVKLAFSKDKVFGPYSMAQGYGILYIESRKETKEKALVDKAELINLKVNAVINMYIERLLKNAKIKINKEML